MKKYIIIIGEEYWNEVKFEWDILQNKIVKEVRQFNEAKYLLETLNKNKTKYEYKLLNGPKNFIDTIKELGPENIRAIFYFHDVFSDSILNKFTVNQMMTFLKDIENKYNIFMYPGLDNTFLFASKRYYKTLIEKLPHTVLPHSKVYVKYDYQGYKDEKEINTKLFLTSKYLLKDLNKIIIKKGHSYEGKQVAIITREDVKKFSDFYEKIRRINKKEFWGIRSSAIDNEIGIDRYYILQGYNSVIALTKFNEYRVFFINGKALYISWADEYQLLCIDDVDRDDEINISNVNTNIINYYYNNDGDRIKKDRHKTILKLNKNLLIEVLRFAKKTYKEFLPLFWTGVDPPILLRLDISYAIDDKFIDEHAINIEGFNSKVRLYINEIEIDPTNYFYNNIVCKKNKKITDEYLEKIFGESINNYIIKNL